MLNTDDNRQQTTIHSQAEICVYPHIFHANATRQNMSYMYYIYNVK